MTDKTEVERKSTQQKSLKAIDGYNFTQDHEAIKRILREERDQEILTMRLGGKTYQQIAEIKGIHRETARRACRRLGEPNVKEKKAKSA